MGKGSNTTSTSSSTSADPQAMQVYRDLLSRAQGVASTPYQAYSGDLTAGINSQQQAGIGGINANAGYASPYIQQAAGQATSSSAPITGGQIQNYMNPYQQSVIDATLAQMGHENQTAQASLTGNQIAQGALGGNATGVARGILAGQQGRTMASTVAGLNQQNYQQALSAAQAQQQTGIAGANALANYGVAGQSAALQGAGAQLSAGTLQQQTEQANLNALYGQYQQQQAYPYQQAQWLAGIGTGVGGALGGTSSGSTTAPPPNQAAQWAGLGLSAAGMFLSDRRAKEDIEHIGETNDGQKIYRYRYKGSPQLHIGLMAQDVEKDQPEHVQHGVDGMRYIDLEGATDDSVRRASGGGVAGTPWAGGVGWIPEMAIHASAPRTGSAPSAPRDQGASFDPTKMAQGIVGVGKGLMDRFGSTPDYGQTSNMDIGGYSMPQFGNSVGVGNYQMPTIGFARGGVVRNWDEPVGMFGEGEEQLAPSASFEDRIAPARFAVQDGTFDPQGSNYTPLAATEQMEASNRGVVPLPMGRPEGAGAPVVADDDDDEAPAPVGVAGRSKGVAAPVMAFAPEGEGSYRDLPDAITRPKSSGLGLGLISPNAQTGLIAAGLGMLSSRSPNLGNAVGDGGIAGFSAYGSAEERDRKIEAEAAKLQREAAEKSQKFGLDIRKQTETERHNKASEKDTAANRAPMGMRFNAKGELEDIPGWLPTLEKAAKARKGPEGELMDDQTAQFMADRIIAGDTKVLTGLGRGAQGAANIMKVQKLVAERAASGQPVSPAARELLTNAAQFEGLKTAERTQAAIMAKLSVYGRTAFNATDIAENLSKEVPRTQWQPVNRVLLAARTNTGDPKVVALGQALMTLTNEYARAIGGGHGTVHDKEAAEKRLSAAQSPEQLSAVINVMRQEILAEERAMPAARQHIRDIYNPDPNKPRGRSIAGEHGAEPPAGPVAGASGFRPPADAISRVYNGKTYYYNPKALDAKGNPTPYPGQ